MRVFIRQGETLDATVLDNPPACFRPEEWLEYCALVVRSGYRPGGSQAGPTRRARYLPRDDFDPLRQSRAMLDQACEDCTVAYQLSQALTDRCHPANVELTPLHRVQDFDEGDLVIEPGTPGRPIGGKHPPEVRERWRRSAAKRRRQAVAR